MPSALDRHAMMTETVCQRARVAPGDFGALPEAARSCAVTAATEDQKQAFRYSARAIPLWLTLAGVGSSACD